MPIRRSRTLPPDLGERIALFQESAALARRLDPGDLTPDQLEEVSALFKEAVTGRARFIDELQAHPTWKAQSGIRRELARRFLMA